jgi:predicted Zn-dependent protease
MNERNNTDTSTHRKKTGANNEQSKEQPIHYGNFDLEKACRSNKLLKNLREVVQSHQSEIASNFGMSIIHLIEDENDKILTCLNFLIKECPEISLLHRRLAEVFIRKDDYKQAIPHLEKAIKLDSEDLTAKVWLSLSYFKVGEQKKALMSLEDLKSHIFVLHVTDSNWL